MDKRNKVNQFLNKKGLDRIKNLAIKGATHNQIAADLGIARMTLFNWKDKYPEIRQALDAGKEKGEEVAVGSLFKLMSGYIDTEVRIERYKLNGKIIEDDPKFPIKEVVTQKFVPPNMGAVAFYLKCKHQWREKSDVDVNVKPVNPMGGLSVEELKKIAYSGVIDVTAD